MGSRACGTCGLSVPTSWESRHLAAGCAARIGLVKDSQFNAARILLGNYAAAGPRSRRELEEHLLANFPPGDGWKATPSIVEQVVDGYIKFWHLENEEWQVIRAGQDPVSVCGTTGGHHDYVAIFPYTDKLRQYWRCSRCRKVAT